MDSRRNGVLAIHSLGGLTIQLDSQPLIGLASRKAEALLVYLAADPRPHPREVLAELLWDELPQRRAMTNLRVALSSLRKQLKPYLDISRNKVAINPEARVWLDISELQERLTVFQDQDGVDTDGTAEQLDAAFDLYQGEFLEGFFLKKARGFEAWAVQERERLHRLVLEALQEAAAFHLASGTHKKGLRLAQRLIQLDPLMESARRQLMELLAASGQRAAALAQFETLRQLLEEELGVAPAEATTALWERIQAGEIFQEPSPDRHPNNLPLQITPFVGRLSEIEALDRLIVNPDVRLITILGPGGMGKTRLALTAAESQLVSLNRENGREAPRFPHGVFFVSLAPLGSADQIVPAVANAMVFRLESPERGSARRQERRSAKQQLLNYLTNKTLLLVLDNYEHLLAGAGLTIEILETAPGVQILATSRERLGLQSEQVFRLEGMPDPDDGADTEESNSAMALFESRARLARANFKIRESNREATGEICRLLGGMPLAIELAAAWVEALSPADIAAEVRRGLDFLETEWDDVAERHRSVSATFESTYARLAENERVAFQNISVFRGGFTRQAAGEVAGVSLITLTRLAHRSLLSYRQRNKRYEIHELLRQFGGEKLAHTPDKGHEVRQHHADFFCATVQRWGKEIRGPSQIEAEETIRNDFDNILAAWHWAVHQKSLRHLDQAAIGLAFYFVYTGQQDKGGKHFRMAADRISELETPVARRVWARTAALHGAFLMFEGGERSSAVQIHQKCREVLEGPDLASLDTRWERAFVLWSLALLDPTQFNMELHQQSLDLARELGDSYFIASNLQSMAARAHAFGDKAKAHRLFEESLDQWRASGDRIGLAGGLETWFWPLIHQGRRKEARMVVQEVIEIYESLGISDRNPSTIGLLGIVHFFDGKYKKALDHFERYKQLASELGQIFEEQTALEWWTESLLLAGSYQQASKVAHQFLAQAEGLERQSGTAAANWMLGIIAVVLGDAERAAQRFEKARELYTAMDVKDMACMVEVSLVYLSVGHRDINQSRALVQHSLQQASEQHNYMLVLPTLLAAAVLRIEQGLIAHAVELYEVASQHGMVANSKYYADTVGGRVAEAARALPPKDLAAAQARGREQDLWKTVDALLAEFKPVSKDRSPN